MRVIKHLKRETPDQKLKRFFAGLTIVTKILLALLVMLALFLGLSSSKLPSLSLFSMRMSEVLLFVVLGLSDLKRQEGKGSYYLILSFTTKVTLLLAVHGVMGTLLPSWPEFEILVRTSIPIQFLFMIMVEDAIAIPDSLKYLFFQPFQLKARYYPLFVFAILMVTGLRVDLLVSFMLALVCHFAKINYLMTVLSNKLDQQYLSERMIEFGFLKTGSHERTQKPQEEQVTNDSIYRQEK